MGQSYKENLIAGGVMSEFSKVDLEKIMASCMAMATMDGEIKADELRPVVAFVEGNWQSGFGDINQLSEKAHEGAGELLKSGSLFDAISEVAVALSEKLDDEQKDSVLKLLSEVLHADDEGHEMEHGMYDIFQNKFQK
jgi:uncharacterized tellurite resistance protein B-like protein